MWGCIIWLDPSLAGSNGEAHSAWREDRNGKHRVELSMGEVPKDVTILLQKGPALRSRNEMPMTTPPLKIELAGRHSQYYLCLASTLPLSTSCDYIPPCTFSSIENSFPFERGYIFARTLPYGIDDDQIGCLKPLGAIYFTCTKPGEDSDGFFVVWGFTTRRMPQGSSRPPKTTRVAWWDEVDMECSVRGSWDLLFPSDQASVAAFDGKQVIESMQRRNWEKGSRYNLPGMMPGECWENDNTKPEGTVVGNHRVKARIRPVDFLDRRSYKLTVEVSDI